MFGKSFGISNRYYNYKKEEMFDLNLSQKKIDSQRRKELAMKLRKDPYIDYIVKAIDYSAGKG